MSEIGKGYVLQNVQMHEMQRQKSSKWTKMDKILSANFLPFWAKVGYRWKVRKSAEQNVLRFELTNFW